MSASTWGSARSSHRLYLAAVWLSATAFGLIAGVSQAAGVPQPASTQGGARATATLITSFATSQFAEGLAVTEGGDAYVSVTAWGPAANDPGTGQVIRVAADGSQAPVGPSFDVGFGFLAGLALDPDGRLYLADASYRGPKRPGIWRFETDGSVARIASFGKLESRLLAPTSAIGVNGLAIRNGALFAAVSDSGRIVKVPMRAGDEAGKLRVVAREPRLVGADGLAFDEAGNLFVSRSPANRVVRLARNGKLKLVAGRKAGLLYPTNVAFAGSASPERLLVVNGDFRGKNVRA